MAEETTMKSIKKKRKLEKELKASAKKVPVLYSSLSAGKRILYTAIGFFRYHWGRPKSIVLVFSSMRAGSTLLKSLIGEAGDASLIDEFNFPPYVKHNKYLFYGLASALSDARIIVLKKPYNNNPRHLNIYGKSPMPGAKKIILYRNPYDTLCSLRNLQVRRNKRRFSDEELVDYWCNSYESLLQNTQEDKVLAVKYEQLTSAPKLVTKDIFAFIGSQQMEGVDRYSEYDWVGGRDDVSDRIKGLEVAEARNNNPDLEPDLYSLIDNSDRVREILHRLDLLAKCNASLM